MEIQAFDRVEWVAYLDCKTFWCDVIRWNAWKLKDVVLTQRMLFKPSTRHAQCGGYWLRLLLCFLCFTFHSQQAYVFTRQVHMLVVFFIFAEQACESESGPEWSWSPNFIDPKSIEPDKDEMWNLLEEEVLWLESWQQSFALCQVWGTLSPLFARKLSVLFGENPQSVFAGLSQLVLLGPAYIGLFTLSASSHCMLICLKYVSLSAPSPHFHFVTIPIYVYLLSVSRKPSCTTMDGNVFFCFVNENMTKISHFGTAECWISVFLSVRDVVLVKGNCDNNL